MTLSHHEHPNQSILSKPTSKQHLAAPNESIHNTSNLTTIFIKLSFQDKNVFPHNSCEKKDTTNGS